VHLEAGRHEASDHVAVRMVRKAGTLLRRKTARKRAVEALVSRGMSPALAETVVPAVQPVALTVYNTGPRLTYRWMKQQYRAGVRG
jgi:hypothetical protein